MFENAKNMAAMIGQAKQMKEKFQQLQDELGQRTVEADAGAGAVRVVANGRLEIVAVHLDRPLLTTLVGDADQADHRMVQELIVAATNAALTKARQMLEQEMLKFTGGLNIPGLSQLAGMPGSAP